MTPAERMQALRRDLDNDIAPLVSDVATLMRRHFNRQARNAELTSPQWQVVAAVFRADGATQTELAEALDMAKSPLGKLIDKLEESGWVERRADAQDGRLRRIHLNRRIERYIDPLSAIADALTATALEGVASRDRQVAARVLMQMRTNLTRALDTAAEPMPLPPSLVRARRARTPRSS